MKVARLLVDGEPRTAIVEESPDRALVLDRGVTLLDALTTSDRAAHLARSEARPLDRSALIAPLDPPSIRDFSVFEQHIEGILFGQGSPIPDSWYESPFCYFSSPGAVTTPGASIPIPPGCAALDFELEVAIVIGRAGRDIAPEDAQGYIAGYTIFNDWSARDLQMAEMKLGLGICKGKDFANTIGPWVVTPDELEQYRVGDRLDLDLRAQLNGQELGDDTLANMAWSFEELISYASRGTWLRPGDVIGSGTCGSGALIELRARRDPELYPWLVPGDTVTLSVQGIGTLTNTVTAGVEPITLPRARPGRLRSRATV
jgi:2-keto-4-pentenoate hydratase/2-oxohepta-3-ene-1,7-dioic acid hydratase in catechol pathway